MQRPTKHQNPVPEKRILGSLHPPTPTKIEHNQIHLFPSNTSVNMGQISVLKDLKKNAKKRKVKGMKIEMKTPL